MPNSCSYCNVEQDDDQEFKRFDIVSDMEDHIFYKNRKELGSETKKKIMKEWQIINESLPDSIYVRAYETRMDLLRAVIVGANGTPYHDGLYFFDVQFPLDYPQNPPDVKHRSHGMRINPNIYSDGKVCLSLLDTWIMGKGSERWDPRRSTILQVLVSIQALVLNEKPYYNEPTLLSWMMDERYSLKYNERVFALACESAVCLLSKKPRNFEGFVVKHYKERAGPILEACRAYCSGRVRVGYYGAAAVSVRGDDVSDKFKKSMVRMYARLVEGFEENGIRVSDELVDLGVVVEDKRSIGCWNIIDSIVDWIHFICYD